MKEMTKEELEMRVKRLQADFNTSTKIADRLAHSLARKEVELAQLQVKLEEVSLGFKALQEKLEKASEDKEPN